MRDPRHGQHQRRPTDGLRRSERLLQSLLWTDLPAGELDQSVARTRAGERLRAIDSRMDRHGHHDAGAALHGERSAGPSAPIHRRSVAALAVEVTAVSLIKQCTARCKALFLKSGKSRFFASLR